MTQPQRIIYLPPGVVPGPGPQQQGGPAVIPSGIPFDRAFFEQLLSGAVDAFSTHTDCQHPLVEILTVDGATHFVKGISGVADQWVALHVQEEDHEEPVQVFVPYQTVFRVSIHPCEEHNRKMGFLLGQPKAPVLQSQLEAPKPEEKPAPKRGSRKK